MSNDIYAIMYDNLTGVLYITKKLYNSYMYKKPLIKQIELATLNTKSTGI